MNINELTQVLNLLSNVSEEKKGSKKNSFTDLIGKNVTIFCCRYIYHGKLIEEQESYIKLEKPSIVYETGSFEDEQFKDIQSLKIKYWFINKESIESFGILNKKY